MVSTLRDRRRRAGVTQQGLADLAECSRSMVRLLEGGYQPPRSPTLRRIERVLAELEKQPKGAA
jgi:predicted transcriptional regulator